MRVSGVSASDMGHRLQKRTDVPAADSAGKSTAYENNDVAILHIFTYARCNSLDKSSIVRTSAVSAFFPGKDTNYLFKSKSRETPVQSVFLHFVP
jgi:hypothetical protein